MSRIKGVTLIEIVRVLRKNRVEAEALVPAAYHGYLRDRLLANEWYPEEDYLVLLKALGALLRPAISGDVWEFIGETGAEQDFGGVYSAVVRKHDPWSSLMMADKIWKLYRDTGRLTVTREGPGKARVELSAYPSVCPEVCGTVTGYLKKLVHACGARDVRVRLLSAQPANLGPSEWSIEFTARSGKDD